MYVQVLKGFNLDVNPGETVALVGPSGCGKSTTIALMEEFYQPLSGAILVDGHELSKVDAKHYRKHVSLVSQQVRPCYTFSWLCLGCTSLKCFHLELTTYDNSLSSLPCPFATTLPTVSIGRSRRSTLRVPSSFFDRN
jgi:ABC-type Mn2+/Zn2+ transport system ATPase subunit